MNVIVKFSLAVHAFECTVCTLDTVASIAVFSDPETIAVELETSALLAVAENGLLPRCSSVSEICLDIDSERI